jgi:long-chain acyl-CoA synthetase
MRAVADPDTPTSARAVDWRKSWLAEYTCDMPSSVPYPRVALSELLRRAARLHPDRVACTLYGKATTFAGIDEQARRLATSLIRLGAQPGRPVGLLLPNIPDYLVALQAVWLTGATALQLSPLMVAEEIDHWIEATGCKIVITLDLLAPVVTGSFGHGPLEHIVLTSLAGRVSMWRGLVYNIIRFRRTGELRVRDSAVQHKFATLLQAEPLARPAEVVPEEDVAVLAPTGGTTASPKAVMLTHKNLVANAMQLRNWVGGEDAQDGVLAVLPFFHAYGLTVSLLSSWAACNTVYLYPRFEAKAVLGVIETMRPTILPAVPAMLSALNKVMRGKPHDLSFVREVLSGASALSAEVRTEFEGWGVNQIVEGYGLTEASPVTHVNGSGDANHPGTIGAALPDTECRMIDSETGRECLPGEVGELLVRGPQVMKGYFNSPLATEETLRGGWLHTGDIVRRDGDWYTIVDRKRDIIKTSGFLVFPAEVEEVLCTHPDVAEAAVVGVPDHERGELVKALVVARTGRALDVSALMSYCALHLGKQKRPRQIEVVAELPRNFLGKILRRKLREPVGVSVMA